jgi:AraC family transcriptional regulator of adaptative response/methylated-DNA-[protein]-cysteine methyltransferase
MMLLPPRPEMEQAFLASDASYDGLFFTGVRTTGIFCRPSCSAKKPRPENVEFFGTVKDAMFAGYRPCKRCRPIDNGRADADWARDLIAQLERNPAERITEQDLRDRGLEPARVRRYFMREYGMTFQAYCRARRLGSAFERLREGETVDEAVFDAGFESHSGFRDAFARMFGKPPGQAQEAGCVRVAWIETPLGPMVAGATEDGVSLLEFTDRRMLEAQLETVRRRFRAALIPGDSRHLAQLRTELKEYFEGRRREFSVPIIYPGTPFEQEVWSALLRIPYGETRSYEDLATSLGRRGAQRAVGHANGMNRIAIVIPCHRVTNKDGQLGGYGGGLWRKRILLELERTGGAGLADDALRRTAGSRV